MHKKLNSLGFSLLETMVAALLLSLVMTFTMPAMAQIVTNLRLRSGKDALMHSLQLARVEAIRRNGRVVICRSTSGSACAQEESWEQGWIVFLDPNGNSQLDPQESVIYREGSLGVGLKVTGNLPVSSYVAYTGLGRTALTSGAFQAGSLFVCETPPRRASQGYQILISSFGRARAVKATLEQCTAPANA